MIKGSIYTVLALVALCFFAACGKDEGVVFSEVPLIRISAVQPMTVQEFEERITITIDYEDGDGDLGFEDPDEYSLEVLDSRLTEPDLYHVPPLSPVGSTISIKGSFNIELKNSFLLGNGNQESVTYKIKIRDRKGNWSNEVQTPVVTVIK